jgi:hypothetical protein
MKPRDLGLTYEQAAYGVQTAVLHEMNRREREMVPDSQDKAQLRTSDHHLNGPKHLRVGLNMSKADQLGLVLLLISKGVFTEEEYIEAVRLSANEELARYQADHPGVTFR